MMASKPPASGFTSGVLAATDGIAGRYSTSASLRWPSSEVRKSIKSLPALRCGALRVRPIECISPAIGSSLSPLARGALLGAQHRVMIEDVGRDRVLTQNDLIQDCPIGRVEIDDVLLAERA